MKRRVFGTVERVPSKRYRAYYKHESRPVYAQRTFATKADASLWLANTETDLGRGTWVDPRRGQEPFHQHAGTWMIRSDLAGSTHVANLPWTERETERETVCQHLAPCHPLPA